MATKASQLTFHFYCVYACLQGLLYVAQGLGAQKVLPPWNAERLFPVRLVKSFVISPNVFSSEGENSPLIQ